MEDLKPQDKHLIDIGTMCLAEKAAYAKALRSERVGYNWGLDRR